MCLLSIGLETLGLLLRVWLWIAVILLLVATWLNYLRTVRSKGSLRLAVEGLGGEVRPGNDELERVEPGGDWEERDQEESEREESEREESDHEQSEREELTATGKETIYQGILWMKEKYEQYREQADRQLAAVRVQLDLKRAIVEDLEAQLRSERLKVGELVQKLQANSELMLRIYRELESVPDLGK
jgi:hypothetical protein